MVEVSQPSSKTLYALKGTISEPISTTSHKPSTMGQRVEVNLVENGAGMVGLENREDNKEWSGIFNHIIKTARVATYLAEELKKSGEDINPNLVLNSILMSHAGRRQWDESNWYPDAVADSKEKTALGDQKLTSQILEAQELPKSVMDTVDAHGVGTRYPIEMMDTWEKKLALYADFRTSQDISSLSERFSDLAQRAVPAGRLTQKQLDTIEGWATKTEKEIFSHLSINPEDLSEELPKQPRWEQYIRRLYISDAEEGIFERLTQLHKQINNGGEEAIDKEFPQTTWWGKYVRELYDTRHGDLHTPRVGKQIGITRAIEYYRWLESTDLDGKSQNLPTDPLS